MKIINRTLFAILILTIPLICILAAVNVSARLPDIYRYEFNRSEIIGEMGLGVTSDELARFFSQYMLGTLDDFQYTDVKRERPVFGIGEAVFMGRLRSLLNLSLFCLAGMVCFALFTYWFLLRQGRKEAVRFAYKAGMVLYAGLVAGIAFLLYKGDLLARAFDRFLLYRFEETDAVPQLLPPVIVLEIAVVAAVLSLIVLLAGYSITKRLTRVVGMFY
ncbi:MAG: hypothetical protein LBS24_04550 [Clostridiales Family XIII bacterium]|jgi:hypothetical protein|nr:hypothetical protein [Clostridiales Family XIII bacterium]